ncbi:hypothetical protein GR160_01530 [Flavobacterium sp. Sd200]|uniref:hypothetical protein n=1 Tax=Flavobacterium sp. Sd200 TaxID=2692211 RepID=UPI00136A7CAC|nr:hypothetical protein [Flavobacterium sp. Sd200]MXN89895.1 hypothetical protein [Flavobacterium sp. Sd200]
MKSISIASLLFIASCTTVNSPLKQIGKLSLKEVSGLIYIKGQLYGQEDSGNKSSIYKIGLDGTTQEEIKIVNAKNTDWEDLASDKQGNIYIGDFGNNKNDRKDLAIYRLNADDLSRVSSVISFHYPDQKEFPPKKSNLVFDVEAFLEQNGNFYLFTKNRSKGFNGEVKIYRVPNKAGNHTAELLGTLSTCDNFRKCAITGADLSPDGTKAVLLSGAKVWLITNFGNGNFAKGKLQEFDLGHTSQKEGICFKDNNTLLIADEKDKKEGGKLYEIKLSDLKAK